MKAALETGARVLRHAVEEAKDETIHFRIIRAIPNPRLPRIVVEANIDPIGLTVPEVMRQVADSLYLAGVHRTGRDAYAEDIMQVSLYSDELKRGYISSGFVRWQLVADALEDAWTKATQSDDDVTLNSLNKVSAEIHFARTRAGSKNRGTLESGHSGVQ